MKNTKLIKLLQTFSAAEVRKFKEFVISPYYNKNKNVIRLNEVLLKFHPDFDSKSFTDENIYISVFGKSDYEYFKIKNVSSDLYNLGLEFLRLTPNPATEFISEYNLIVQLRLRKLFNIHGKLVKSIEKSFNEIKIKDNAFLYNSYLISTESQFVDLFEKPSSISGIVNEFGSFFEYFINNLLHYYNLLIHISKDNNVKLDIKMMKEVTAFLELGAVSDHPVTLSYSYLILLKTKGEEEYFFRLKEHYFNNFELMNEFSAYTVHMYMFGYCADKYNIEGDRRFIKEGYELYRHSYLNGRVTSGELLYPDFVNYIKIFVRAGDTQLARKFIADYAARLQKDQLDNCLNFSNAYISHFEGDYNIALKLISMVSFPLAILKVQVRILEVQLNFQLGYYEETRSLIESFKKTFIKEAVISDSLKESILSFLKSTINLINLKQESDRERLKLELSRQMDIVSKTQKNHFGIKFWLEDRLNEIK
ncbi:MAG TPA: hypothetical protein VG961_03150 [Ignavibacteria bacterium]|nr:hypothetical protein [Ignavibacteria bacterium]